MNIELRWSHTGNGEENLQFSRVLYAYLHPESHEVLYLGKADYSTVQERRRGPHKDKIFAAIASGERLSVLHAIVGTLYLPEGARYSSELLSDVESLLIIELQPRYNEKSKCSRICRPGLMVKCQGDWPTNQKTFHDR